jgi:hypothetical protein
MVDSGAWGKLIHEKKSEVENLVALSLSAFINCAGPLRLKTDKT